VRLRSWITGSYVCRSHYFPIKPEQDGGFKGYIDAQVHCRLSTPCLFFTKKSQHHALQRLAISL
jgi:hypothetical protein